MNMTISGCLQALAPFWLREEGATKKSIISASDREGIITS